VIPNFFTYKFNYRGIISPRVANVNDKIFVAVNIARYRNSGNKKAPIKGLFIHFLGGFLPGFLHPILHSIVK